MKRRLDLALALVHGPRVLFLDEPTTGLDPQSRAALWDEVSRLAGQEGVTVFLTTQYLEEADVLADRVGIIDDGKIVAEGTPDALKDEIGRPSLEITPCKSTQSDQVLGVMQRFGERVPAARDAVAVRLEAGQRGLPTSSGRSTPRASGSTTSISTLRASTTSSSRRPAATSRAPATTGRCRPANNPSRGPQRERRRRRRPGGLEPGSTLSTQILTLAGRAALRTLRQPAMIFPSLVFPLFLLAVNSAGLNAATQIPGFPTDSYLTFVLAVPFIQGALFSTMNSGQALAEDIENGFFNRLALTPMRGSSLIAGQLGGLVVIGLIQATIYLAVGLAAGAHFEAGVAGVPVLLALSVLISIGFGGIGMFMAIRTGSGEAVQGMFPLFFVFLFFSSISMPRNLIEHEWFRTIATINPVSYLIEGIRSLFIYGWDGEALALAFGIAIALIVISISIASLALRGRMERT